MYTNKRFLKKAGNYLYLIMGGVERFLYTYVYLPLMITYFERVVTDGGTIMDETASDLQIGQLLETIDQSDIKLLMIPDGYKAGTKYSVIPSNGDGDFTVARAGTKTIINKQGNIETVALNTPAINWIDGVPVINVERQATQLLTRPISFDHADWTKSGATVTGGFAAPAVDENGDVLLDAFKLVEGTNDGYHYIAITANISVSAENITKSIYVKSAGRNWISLYDIEISNSFGWFNISTGELGTTQGGAIKITPLVDGWFKCSITNTATTASRLRIYLAESDNDNFYQGDGTSGIYIYNAQLEQGSVATSPVYIDKSLESAQRTRLADAITTAVDYSNIKTLVINDDAFIVETALPDNGYQLSQLPVERLLMSESVLSDAQIAALGATKRQLAFSSYVNIGINTSISISVDGVGYIDWGDGTTSAYSSPVTLSHTYAGGYKGLIKFVGTLTYIHTLSDVNWYFDLKDLPANLTTLHIQGSNTISGDIANAPANLTSLRIDGSNQLNIYTVGRTWSNNQNYIYLRQAVGFGLDSTEVDNLLIDLANVTTWVGAKTVDIRGANAARTSASDAAVTTLQGKGVTVNTK